MSRIGAQRGAAGVPVCSVPPRRPTDAGRHSRCGAAALWWGEVLVSRVGVFCGVGLGRRTAYRDAAVAFGTALARRRIGLVYGGAAGGMMGAVAGAALAAGGAVVGVLPAALLAREPPHPGLTRLHVVGSLSERKTRMAELSDAFVALPGGLGTLDELAEVLAWARLGLHAKPIGVLNTAGFYDPLLTFLAGAAEEGFVVPEHASLVVSGAEPEDLLEALVRAR